LLRHSLALGAEAAALEQAVAAALREGARTPDIAPAHCRALSTREAGDAVLSRLQRRD
jgi:3-isopropylmalate dehydrogenase